MTITIYFFHEYFTVCHFVVAVLISELKLFWEKFFKRKSGG